MKNTDFNKIIEGKDLTKAEDAKAILDAINDSENTLMKRKEDSFNEKYTALAGELERLKGDYSKAKETSERLINVDKENTVWKNKAYIYKNVNSELDESDVSDLITLVNARMATNSKLKFEDAVKEVSEKRGFVKKAAVKEETKQEEPVYTPSVGVTARTASSTGVDFSDNSKDAQLGRFNQWVNKGK